MFIQAIHYSALEVAGGAEPSAVNAARRLLEKSYLLCRLSTYLSKHDGEMYSPLFRYEASVAGLH